MCVCGRHAQIQSPIASAVPIVARKNQVFQSVAPWWTWPYRSSTKSVGESVVAAHQVGVLSPWRQNLMRRAPRTRRP